MNPPPQMPQMPANAPSPKNGMHPLGWVGIGCGALLLLGVIGAVVVFFFAKRTYTSLAAGMVTDPNQTVAESVIEMTPEIDWADEDIETGEITVRVVETGEELTFSYEDIAQGKVKFTGADGVEKTIGGSDVSQLPAWVPQYPRVVQMNAIFQSELDGGMEGVLSFSTHDTMDDIEKFYDAEMSGFSSVGSSSLSIGSTSESTFRYADGSQEMEVTATRKDATRPIEVRVTYSDSAP